MRIGNLFHFEKVEREESKPATENEREKYRYVNCVFNVNQPIDEVEEVEEISKNLILYIQANTNLEEEIILDVLKKEREYYNTYPQGL